MTGFAPKFFSSGTGVLEKGSHSRLGELIVHFGVAGLADFRACILFIGLSAFFSASFAVAIEALLSASCAGAIEALLSSSFAGAFEELERLSSLPGRDSRGGVEQERRKPSIRKTRINAGKKILRIAPPR